MIKIKISDPIIPKRPKGDSWIFLKKFAAVSPDLTHHPLVSEDVITWNKAQQRSQQRVAQRGLILLFPLIHLNLSDPASLILIWNIPKEMQPKSNIQNSNTSEEKPGVNGTGLFIL